MNSSQDPTPKSLKCNTAIFNSFCPSDLASAVTSMRTRRWEEHSVSKLPAGNKKQDQEISRSNLGAELFGTSSSSCLNGQISGVSKYQVATGGYSDVWTGLWGQKKVAIKVARGFSSHGRRIEKSELLKRIGTEYLIWSNLRHENVLECLGFSYDFGGPAEHRVPSLVSPWMSQGTVITYIQANPDADRLGLLIGIAKGLCYLHSREPAVVHGDIRAGNVVISHTGIPKLNDFGLSRSTGDSTGVSTSDGPEGSLRWMAPELLHGENISKTSDVWAFGMNILEVGTGCIPYEYIKLEPVVLKEIFDGHIPRRPTASAIMTDDLWEICLQCWRLNPVERLDTQEVLIRLIGLGQPKSLNVINQ
ncbi:kinase-like domain-containing protein [Hysterangium stoloniferum]|nr:kinase-like domain-containing protein [Hysterangium stoloniferum]